MDSVVLTVLREPRTYAPANGPAQNIADPVGGVPAEVAVWLSALFGMTPTASKALKRAAPAIDARHTSAW
jgi:hypothetical protein